MKRTCLMLIALFIMMTGCNSHQEKVEAENHMPMKMPADFEFLVRFGYGVTKNEVNTYADTVTKDLVMKGSATADIALSPEEMRSIYEQMRAINIMGTKKLVSTRKNCSQIPFSEEEWKISVNGETKTLAWSDENCDVTADAKQLLELRQFIQNIVEEKEAYKKLPAAEGGYD